jgi:hypothetical protein
MEFGFCVEIISCLCDLKIRCLKIAEVKKKSGESWRGELGGREHPGGVHMKIGNSKQKQAIQNAIILPSATA